MRKRVEKREKMAFFTHTIYFFTLLFILCNCMINSAFARRRKPEKELFSPAVAENFYEIAYDIINQPKPTSQDYQQALLFLQGTTKLDSRARYAEKEMILTTSRTNDNYTRLLIDLLRKYMDENADLEVVVPAMQYLISFHNTREDRLKSLDGLVKIFGSKNSAVASMLTTEAGLLVVETGDPNAIRVFAQAYEQNRYNRLAYDKFHEFLAQPLGVHQYLERFRLNMIENPLDMQAALQFASYAEQTQMYELSYEGYTYAANLHEYLFPKEPLPSSIYLPWMLSAVNTQHDAGAALVIAEKLKQQNIENILIDAIAAVAARVVGEDEMLEEIITNVKQTSLEKYQSGPNPGRTALRTAWFYCFALGNLNEAVDWANKAYSKDPNAPQAASLLAYCLAGNGSYDVAKLLIENKENQLADLAMALIQSGEEKNDEAIERFRKAIERDPASLESAAARSYLNRLGGEYIPPVNVTAVTNALEEQFEGDTLYPLFRKPDEFFDAQLNLRGDKFFYDSDLDASLSITNRGEIPLLITDYSMFKGTVRIDAIVTGDIEMEIPELVLKRFRPALPVDPGENILLPINLNTGKLKTLLLRHPQASLNIEFKTYLDPVVLGGEVYTKIPDIAIQPVKITRAGVEVTTKFLQNRLDVFNRGQASQRIKNAKLFIGLLREQLAFAKSQPPYTIAYADWMPEILKAAVLQNLKDDDWTVKTQTMSAMFDMPLDFKMTRAISENLQDDHWPVRVVALYLLNKKQGDEFKKVLDWTAEFDKNEFVRNLAVALGGKQPPQPEENPQAPNTENIDTANPQAQPQPTTQPDMLNR